MANISFGTIAKNVSFGVKVTRDENNKIYFAKDGCLPVCCFKPMDDKNEISPEALVDFLEFFKDEFQKEISEAIFACKQNFDRKRYDRMQDDF